jgi:hypothetical protein
MKIVRLIVLSVALVSVSCAAKIADRDRPRGRREDPAGGTPR